MLLPRIFPFLSAAIAGAFLLPTLLHAAPRIVAYMPNWGDVKAQATQIDYAKLTHLNVAFENPGNDAGDLSFDAQDDVLIAQGHAHGVRVLISIGGGSASEDAGMRARYAGLLAEGKRAGFVARLAAYVAEHHFDGLDVDLEGPAITGDYGAFIAALAGALRPQRKLLTAALSKGYGGSKVPESTFAHFDFVNIMAYDAAGPWNKDKPGPHASREFAQENVDYWLQRGLSREKAVLGVPFYGNGFGESYRKRSYSYAELVAAYPGAEKLDQVGKTIWYNGQPTMRWKAQAVLDQGLGGIMIWSLDSDVPGPRSLLSALYETLHPAELPGGRPPTK